MEHKKEYLGLVVSLTVAAFAIVMLKVCVPRHGGFCSFGIISMLVPLLGYLRSWNRSFTAGMGVIAIRMAFGFSSFMHITLGLPTIAAASCLHWIVQSARDTRDVVAKRMRLFFEVLVPVVCMLAFSLGPNTYIPYSFYWFIPMIMYVTRLWQRGAFAVVAPALSSSFVAHALGSVFWMLLVPMTPASWQLLIPVVALERALFIGGMASFVFGARLVRAARGLAKGAV